MHVADCQSWRTLKGYPTISRILNHAKMHMLIIFWVNFGGSFIFKKRREKKEKGRIQRLQKQPGAGFTASKEQIRRKATKGKNW